MPLLRTILALVLTAALPAIGQVRFDITGSIYLGSVQVMDTASVVQTITNTSDRPLVLSVRGLDGNLCSVRGPSVLTVPPNGATQFRIVAQPRRTGRIMDTMYVSDGIVSVWRIVACDGLPLAGGSACLVPFTDTMRINATSLGQQAAGTATVRWVPGTSTARYQLTALAVESGGNGHISVGSLPLPIRLPQEETAINMAVTYRPDVPGTCDSATVAIIAHDSIAGGGSSDVIARFRVIGCLPTITAGDTALPVFEPAVLDLGVVAPGDTRQTTVSVEMLPGSAGSVTDVSVVGPTTDCSIRAIPRTPLPLLLDEFSAPLVIDVDYEAGYHGTASDAWVLVTVRERDGDSSQFSLPVRAYPMWGRIGPDTLLVAAQPGRVSFGTVPANEPQYGECLLTSISHDTVRVLSADIVGTSTAFRLAPLANTDSLLLPRSGGLPIGVTYNQEVFSFCDDGILRVVVARPGSESDVSKQVTIEIALAGCTVAENVRVVRDTVSLSVDSRTARVGETVTIAVRFAASTPATTVDSADVTLTYNTSALVPLTPLVGDTIRDGTRMSTVRTTAVRGIPDDILVAIPFVVTHGDMTTSPLTASVVWYTADTVRLDRLTRVTPGTMVTEGIAHRLVNPDQAALALSSAPQPAVDAVVVRYRTDRTATLAVFDAMGNRVLTYPGPLVAPSGTAIIPVAALPRGTYILRLSAGPHTAVLPITRQ